MARVAPAIQRLLARPPEARRIGPFVLVSPLGRGGFAPVWLAKEVYGATELRLAAVKLFSLEAVRDRDRPGASADVRILEEARALCRVEHPHVVRFYALPVDEATQVMGLAMEHVGGTPLHQRLEGRGRLSVPEALSAAAAIAWALAAVHGAGLVHRDVKPANVIEASGVYKLIDFGIAAADAPPCDDEGEPAEGSVGSPLCMADLPQKALGSKLSDLSDLAGVVAGTSVATGSTVRAAIPCGTVGYIDPASIALGAKAAPAGDLYALGAMLFECLTGSLPAAVGAPRGAALRGEVLDGRARAPKLQELLPEAPPALARLVDALLAPDRPSRPASAERVARELERIQASLAGRERALPPERVGPFRGLGRFDEGDSRVYFGRASEIAAALEALRGRGVVALVGPSGSGKSSLARAGVLPAVAEGALGGFPARWDCITMEPGRDPRAALDAALLPLLGPAHPSLAKAGPSAEARVLALAERAERQGRGVILLIDQLEELATLAEPAGRAFLVDLIVRLGEQVIPGVRVVAAARRDLLDLLLGIGDLGKTLMRASVLIEPMTAAAWGDVLDQALAAYGYTFEDAALRDELLAELAGTASAMPLVQFALTALWDKRDRHHKRVTREGLRAIGGIAGALEQHADATLAALTGALSDGRLDDRAAAAARAALLALTTPEGTRAPRSRAELVATVGSLGEEAVSAFERARLITSSATSIEGASAPHVTLAHEALLTQWGRLRAWVAEARDDRLLADDLERDAARFRADPDAVPLWKKHRLAYGEALRARHHVGLSADAVTFLKKSRSAARAITVLAACAGALGLVMLLGGAGVVIHAARTEEAATRLVLRKEQEGRELAERQKRELERQQARLDQAIRDLGMAPTEEQMRALQRQLDERLAAAPASAPPPPSALPPRERPRAVAPATVRAPPPQEPLAERSPSKPSSLELKPDQVWDELGRAP